ncbi:hypothetical protein CYMTET_9216 [Cymbomonas tetramitiformis]|uniref:Uncharacterized protein n=1 Tax=Cymbomonas tetramitiformis TaxID=36881 RepID=A0AAE0GS77_9CHLO|nr:hypothetical protein CYMTET_9216 [Cymbomonas tetramitiformis]
MLVTSILVFVVYVLGIPGLFAAVLYHGLKNNLLTDKSFMAKFAWLYDSFELEWVWWCMLIFVRRVVCAAVLVFAARYDIMESTSLLSLSFTVISGLVYYTKDNHNINVDSWTGIFFVAIALQMGLAFGIFAYDVYLNRTASAALKDWIRNEPSNDKIAMLYELGQCLLDLDSASVEYQINLHNTTFKARFYNTLFDGFPYIVDWMADASEAELANAERMFEGGIEENNEEEDGHSVSGSELAERDHKRMTQKFQPLGGDILWEEFNLALSRPATYVDEDGVVSDEYLRDGNSLTRLTGRDGKESAIYYWALRKFVYELNKRFFMRGTKEKNGMLKAVP